MIRRMKPLACPLRLLFASSLALACISAFAQPFPAKPLRMVVPFPPGGAADFQTRPVAQKMAESLGQPVIVDNRAGGDGIIGAEITMKAPADGYTFMFGTSGTHLFNVFFHKSLSYDPVRDFTALSFASQSMFVLTANPGSGVGNLQQLIVAAKQKPGQLGFASTGNGSAQHVAGELLKKLAGIDLLHVPYKGGAQGLNDNVGGAIPLGMFSLSTALTQVTGGKLRALAVTGTTRAPALPDVPTIAEVVPGYAFPSWSGFFAPAALPAPLTQRLNRELVAALRAPEVVKLYDAGGVIAVSSTPEAFRDELTESLAKWRGLMKELKLGE